MIVRIQEHDFDAGQEITKLQNEHSGAIVSFVGCVRDFNQKTDPTKVAGLTLEHYPGMTEKTITDIIAQAENRWEVLGCTVIHRIGTLQPAEQIVLVVISSSHRKDAFAACEFIMDFLKTQAPFWKKSHTNQGEVWVDAKDSDSQAIKKWH